MNLSMMPTAAKLVAGLLFAGVAFMAGNLVVPYLREGTAHAKLPYVTIFFGFYIGYRMSGRRAGSGNYAGFGYALTSAFLITIWCLFAFAASEAYGRSLKRLYDGVQDALTDMIYLMIEYGGYLLNWDILAVIIGGSLLAGWLTERTARAWS